MSGLTGSALWGFMRSVRIEAPRMSVPVVDWPAEAVVAALETACGLAEPPMWTEVEAACRMGVLYVP